MKNFEKNIGKKSPTPYYNINPFPRIPERFLENRNFEINASESDAIHPGHGHPVPAAG